MLVALHVHLNEFHFLKLEFSFFLEQVVNHFESVLGWEGSLGSLLTRVGQHFGFVNVQATYFYELVLQTLDVLEDAVINYVNSEIVFDVDLLKVLVDLDEFDATHQFN